MINGGRVLGLIPARGGSKGVPRKNLRLLGGKPLLQWTVEAARGSSYIDRLVLSTDDDEIAGLGRSLGVEVPFMRPADAASDEASTNAVIRHTLANLDERFDFLVLLQPTSPLRTTDDIDGCLERLASSDADGCVSLTKSPVKPEWLFIVGPDSTLTPALPEQLPLRRQELRAVYQLNGAVYASRVAAYVRTGTFLTDRTTAWIMPTERSVDVDDLADFDRAEAILNTMSRVVS